MDGKSCMQLAAGDCSDEKVRGQSSNEACCQCGGGVVTHLGCVYHGVRDFGCFWISTSWELEYLSALSCRFLSVAFAQTVFALVIPVPLFLE